jgi:hypothetical protein
MAGHDGTYYLKSESEGWHPSLVKCGPSIILGSPKKFISPFPFDGDIFDNLQVGIVPFKWTEF